MENHQPFVLSCSESNGPTTRVSCSTPPIPTGKRFVVEHISGHITVGTGFPIDQILATDDFGQEVYLPAHFASREFGLGGDVGTVQVHQFGSPARMYIEAGRSITISGDAKIAAEISATAIGYLVDV